MKNYIKILILVIFAAVTLKAETEPSLFKVYLKMDKLKFQESEDIILHINIKNLSGERNSFTAYDRDDFRGMSYTTFQPVVYDMSGRMAELIVPYKMQNKSIEQILPDLLDRNIELGPNETFTHTVNLAKFFKLSPGIKYRVRGLFYPDIKSELMIKGDNELIFKLDNDRSFVNIRSGMVEKTEDRSYSREIAPSEIITLALNAEKNNDWERLRKYIFIEKLISSYSRYVRIYDQSDSAGRKEIEDDFIKFLSRDRHDYIVDFKIIKEFKDDKNNKAFVEALVERSGYKKADRFKYIYTLEKKEFTEKYTNKKSYEQNLWLITNVDAVIMKGGTK